MVPARAVAAVKLTSGDTVRTTATDAGTILHKDGRVLAFVAAEGQRHLVAAMRCRPAERRLVLAGAAALAAMSIATPSRAGEPNCSDLPPAVESAVQAASAAKRLERALDASGAEVAIVARVGSDLSRHGVTYTHSGMVWRDDPAGRWQVIHALNDCGGRYSRIYRQGLMQFFLEQPVRYDALVLVPVPQLRTALVARLASGTVGALHQPLYSTIAYPFATSYQNSNQFVLENLALAQIGVAGGGRETAIEHLRRTKYQPHVVRLTGFERFGGNFRANVHFDDHPARRRRTTAIRSSRSSRSNAGWPHRRARQPHRSALTQRWRRISRRRSDWEKRSFPSSRPAM